MAVSGFTIVRNAVRLDFPVVESIRSILPLCDEVVVNVGASDDETLNLVRAIDDPKIRILETVWDFSKRETLLADETRPAWRAGSEGLQSGLDHPRITKEMLPSKATTSTPSPAASDRRVAPRFEIIAQANVASGGDSYLMTVRNISVNGALLEGRPQEHADLAIGVEVELALSLTSPGLNDDEIVNVQCRGKVARIEPWTAQTPGGFGVTFDPASDKDRELLEELLGRLANLPATQRSA